jgi:hypothetical protein
MTCPNATALETAHERLQKWTADGTWDRILEHILVEDES